MPALVSRVFLFFPEIFFPQVKLPWLYGEPGLRLQELEQQDYNERFLAAACAGDVEMVEETLRKRGDCNSQQMLGKPS